ncbi:MAG: Teichoic acid translocation permease protein TagG [Candidatus Omnitrophica bacterium]|nr:Teichoic acid translocation permease protein TagG [Candidatus Omnitrophota bacterium]
MSTPQRSQRTLIRPGSRSLGRQLSEAIQARELLWTLTQRDIKVRYKQTVLGCVWAVLQPAVSMVIFSIIFGHFVGLSGQGAPYPLFSYSALVVWTFFANSVSAGALSLVSSSSLVTKVYFPRMIVPLASVGVFLVDLAVAIAVFVPVLMFSGRPPRPEWLCLLPATAALLAYSAAIGAGLSALTVRYRDVRYALPFALQTVFYATPIVYATASIPAEWRPLLYLNPVCGVIDVYRAALLGTPWDPSGCAVSLISAGLSGWLSLRYFNKVERSFADIL